MCLKKMPYWLKVGIIGAVIALIYDVIGLFLNNFQYLNIWLLSLILDIIVFFVIGAIIGLIIDIIIKGKRRNSPVRKIKRIRRRR